MMFGVLNLLSMIYLAFVVALVFGMNDHDKPARIIAATLRRWLKLLLSLLVIGVIVYILSKI